MSKPELALVPVAYVEELQKVQFVKKMYASVTQALYLSYTPSNFTPESGLNWTIQQCFNAPSAEYSLAHRKYKLQLNVVQHFERQHNIQLCWTPEDPEYIAVEDYAKHRTFIHTVKELEGLVVQPLFELSKANLVDTGYKMYKHISKYFKILWLKEAIEHLNVDVCQLAAWINHDNKQIIEAEAKLRDLGCKGLVDEMKLFYVECCCVNDIHCDVLDKIYKLEGYSSQQPDCMILEENTKLQDANNNDYEEDKDIVTDVVQLLNYLDHIS
ncbi:hypothetical protein J3R82DRAFT_9875 [Butyriboletus roseoflavus]|nr:hypothetical protein J3R82DRAFT_9875 [Butyriboletus roseoflavus]